MTIQLHVECFGQGEDLSLIHGWGAQNIVWRDWAQDCLAPYYRVHLIELPGFGRSPKISLQGDELVNQAWLKALQAALPESTHLLGWSLGGLLAQQLALAHPTQIKSLTCLASTPRFVQSEHWQRGMPPRLMADFIEALGRDSLALLQRFWKLQLQGSDGARQLMKHLVTQLSGRSLPAFSALLQGLELLRDIDMRQHLVDLEPPTLWLLGEKDPLVPVEWVSELTHLQPSAQVKTIQGAAHLPFSSHPQQTADALLRFLKSLDAAQ